MMTANEKSVNTADKRLKTMLSARYFLYGGTNRRKIAKSPFIQDIVGQTFSTSFMPWWMAFSLTEMRWW